MAGGGGVGVIYRKGKQIRRVAEAEMVDALIDEVRQLLHNADSSGLRVQGRRRELSRL